MSDEAEVMELPSMSAIGDELIDLAQGQSVEKLSPKAVLDWAKANKKSAVYQWLKTKNAFHRERAAEMFALSLCQRLIQRVKVTCHTPDNKPIQVRAFTSTLDDRINGGGYRLTKTVLAAPELRGQMLRTAKMELDALRRKYQHLAELAGVWEAIGNVVDSKESA